VSGPETLATKACADRCLPDARLAELCFAGSCLAGPCLVEPCLAGPWLADLGLGFSCDGLAAADRVGLGAETGDAGFAQPIARKITAPTTAAAAARGLVTSFSVRGLDQGEQQIEVSGPVSLRSAQTTRSIAFGDDDST